MHTLVYNPKTRPRNRESEREKSSLKDLGAKTSHAKV